MERARTEESNSSEKKPVIDRHCRICGAWDEAINEKKPYCDTCKDERGITRHNVHDGRHFCETCNDFFDSKDHHRDYLRGKHGIGK
jgi:hypothetical protein